MRISDWSSDVCSSDLPSLPRSPASKALPFKGRVGWGWFFPTPRQHHITPHLRSRSGHPMTAAETLIQLARGTPVPPLREVDRAFARLLQRMAGTPEVAQAGALAIRTLSLGPSGFPLDGAPDLLDELDRKSTR